MRSATIQCAKCPTTYTIFEPDFVGDMNKITVDNQQVSTEVGCPACLCPDGILCHIDPLNLPIARSLGSTSNGTKWEVTVIARG